MKNKVLIGARGSRLSLAQTGEILKKLSRVHPGIEFEIRVIKTKGDMILNSPLSLIGGKGLFVKEIENALLARRIDLAVHSLKDMPTEIPRGLKIGAVTKREDPRDLIVTSNQKPARLPDGQVTRMRRIGTSSLRRKAQLLAKWPNVQVVDIRGNLDTRIRKMKENNLDGIVVAAAGVKRLKVESSKLKAVPAGRQVVSRNLPISIMLPAPGQGALCIEIRKGDKFISGLISDLNDRTTEQEVTAERSLLEALGGGCQVPIGAYAKTKGDKLYLEGLVASPDGQRQARAKIAGNKQSARRLGRRLARKLVALGAKEILS